MAGRGRGGRGGRGGISKSFNREQLNSMGVGSNEFLPGPVTQPPPLYPLMDHKPVPLKSSVEMDYLLLLKQDLIDHMQLAPSFLKMPYDKNKQPELEIDKLVAQLPNVKEKYDWSLFPSELRPKILASRANKVKSDKKVNVQERLTELEKLETLGKTVVKQEEAVEDEEVLEEEQDEEMDDGTDYANNYFDNGEGYEDEDDNMDDGPIY